MSLFPVPRTCLGLGRLYWHLGHFSLSSVCLPSLPCLGAHTRTLCLVSLCGVCSRTHSMLWRPALLSSTTAGAHLTLSVRRFLLCAQYSTRQLKQMCFPQAGSFRRSPGGWWEGSSEEGKPECLGLQGVHMIPQRPPTHLPLNSERKKCQRQY